MASKSQNKNFTHDKSSKPTSQNFKKKNRNNRRDFTTKGKDDKVMDKKPGGNDPRWWGNQNFVNAVARFNFASPLGKPIPVAFRNDPNSATQFQLGTGAFETIPGVMAIDVLPTMGIATSNLDPLNIYLRNIYAKLRSTNNQSAPYQAPDLGNYILAIDSIHMIIEQLIRVYGIARTYSPMNRYIPEALLNAMGINPYDATFPLYSNLADFRAEILNLIVRIQTLAVPKGIAINERHRELVKYVYKDGESVKSQMYLFRTPYLYKYNPIYDVNGGGLEATATPMGQSAASWINFANTLIDAVTVDQDFAIISGDIIKSFGYESLYGMPYFDELYTVVPVYNPEILLEIHNAKVCGDRYDANSFDVYQDASMNALMTAPYTRQDVGGNGGAGSVMPVIDVPVDTPDPDMVMVATRLAVVGSTGWISADNMFKFIPDAIGTEMVLRLTIYYYTGAGVLTTYDTVNNSRPSNGLYITECPFDWHPHIYVINYSSDHSLGEYLGIVSELSNYTVLGVGDLNKLHDMALLGALTCINVDNVGTDNIK